MSEPLRIPPKTIRELATELMGGDADISRHDAERIAEERYNDNLQAIYRMAQLGQILEVQIEELAQWIIANIPGEPSVSEGAVECAIRIMGLQKTTINQAVHLAVMRVEEVERLENELERAQLAYIEATNPGIDMNEVRRQRLSSPG